jgi:hypothetical protein
VPDFKRLSGSVDMTLTGRKYPQDEETQSSGPLTVESTTEYVNPRLRVRQASIRIECGDVGDDFRMGDLRLSLSAARETMNVTLGQIADNLDARGLVARLRDLVRDVERAFKGIRPDDSIIIGGGTKIAKHLSTTAVWDPGNVAAGAQTTTTVTLTGAQLGDEITCSFNLDIQQMQLTGAVQSADTIEVVLRNGTAGAIDLAEGTLRVSAWRH